MMINPTKEEIEIRKKIVDCKDESKRKELYKELRKILIEQDKKLADCPFCH